MCCKLLSQCCFSLPVRLTALLLEFLETDCHRDQSTGAPKLVPVVSKGNVEMLQMSVWNDLLAGTLLPDAWGALSPGELNPLCLIYR